MLSAIARYAPDAVFAALIAAILSRACGSIMPFILASPNATGNTTYVDGMQAACGSSNYLLIGVLSILLALLGRAMVEANL
jgi:hypothetical protein